MLINLRHFIERTRPPVSCGHHSFIRVFTASSPEAVADQSDRYLIITEICWHLVCRKSNDVATVGVVRIGCVVT